MSMFNGIETVLQEAGRTETFISIHFMFIPKGRLVKVEHSLLFNASVDQHEMSILDSHSSQEIDLAQTAGLFLNCHNRNSNL